MPSFPVTPITPRERLMKATDLFFDQDTWAREAGIELLDVSTGRATVRMEVQERHLNSHGTVHGGVLFTLADTAFALASNSHGTPAAAISAHIMFVTAASKGTLYASAEEFSLNPKIATYTVTITDGEGVRISIFQGMVYRKTPRT